MRPESKLMQHVLVTGATGFIGRRLCRLLQQQGIRVRALARQAASGPWDELVLAELGAGVVRSGLMQGIDTVIHLAGYAHAVDEIDSARIHRQATEEGTRELLSILDPQIQRLLFVSSVKALPTAALGVPDSDYGKSKFKAEQMIQRLQAQGNINTFIIRLPLVYGPGVKGNLRRMLESVARRRFPPLPEFGNRRSMVHVDDVCMAVLQALRSGTPGASYTLTDGQEYSSRGIYLEMRAALGLPPPYLSLPVSVFKLLARLGDAVGALVGHRPGFDSDALNKLAGDAIYDNRLAVEDFSFHPHHCLASALPEMVQAWRKTAAQ